MITEEDAARHVGLPSDQRFYLTERLARERLAQARQEAGQNDWPAFDEFDYMIEVIAAAEAFGVLELQNWELPEDNDDRAKNYARRFRSEATKVSQKLMFRYAGVQVGDPNTVGLDPAEKEKLRFHLIQVRGVVDKSSMPDWKKQDLYAAIASLESEIDKSRTRVGAVLDVVGRAWAGEVAPIDALRQVVMIVQEA